MSENRFRNRLFAALAGALLPWTAGLGANPSANPSANPVEAPAANPSAKPVEAPAANPSAKPAEAPAAKPAEAPGAKPAPNPGPPSRESWIPAESGLVLDAAGAREILDTLLSPPILGRIEASDGWRRQRSSFGGRLQHLFQLYLENRFDCAWPEILKKLGDGGLTVGVGAGGAWGAVLDAESEAFLNEAQEVFLSVGRAAAAKKGTEAFVQDYVYRGVRFWTVSGGKEYHAVLGTRLVVANRLETFKRILDLRAGDATGSIAGVPGYEAAKRSASEGSGKGAVLALSPGALQAWRATRAGQGRPAKEPNPLAVLLLGGYDGILRGGEWLALGIEAGGETLSFRLPTGPAGPVPAAGADPAFARPADAADGALPLLAVPRQLASLSLYRDLGGFYAAKDELFPERTSGLILFENMMGIYFSGRDLADEVMAELDPHIRFVVAGQEYDPERGVPETRVPAFALVLRMRHPEAFSPVVEEAWQKVVGMVNFTRGQKAQGGLVMDRFDHAGVRFTCAAFSAAGEKDKARLDTRFNFSPAIARFGEHLVLSSEEALTRDLIDALKAEDGAAAATPLPGKSAVLEWKGPALAAAFVDNREHFIHQNMVEKGHDRARAEREVSILPLILDAIGAARLEAGSAAGGEAATLRLELNPANPKGATTAVAAE